LTTEPRKVFTFTTNANRRHNFTSFIDAAEAARAYIATFAKEHRPTESRVFFISGSPVVEILFGNVKGWLASAYDH
jgi:hypothetical protein